MDWSGRCAAAGVGGIGESPVKAEGLTLSWRCFVTLSMMSSVREETSGLWLSVLLENDNSSSSTGLACRLAPVPGGRGGEAILSDARVGIPTGLRGLTCTQCGAAGVAGSCTAAGRKGGGNGGCGMRRGSGGGSGGGGGGAALAVKV